MRDLALVFRPVDELVQSYHQNAQLTAGVRGEDRGEAAGTHRDGVHDNGRKQLQTDHDLVRRTVSGVYELDIERTRQLVRLYGSVVDLNDHRCYRGDDAVRAHAALHKDRAEAGHESAELSVAQHHFAIPRSPHDPPVVAHVIHTLAYIVAVQQQRAVIHAGHQPVYHGTESLQLQAHVRLVHNVERARYQRDDDQGVADELDAARQYSVYYADRRAGIGPGAERLEEPAIQLNAVIAVALVRDVVRRKRAKGVQHDRISRELSSVNVATEEEQQARSQGLRVFLNVFQ